MTFFKHNLCLKTCVFQPFAFYVIEIDIKNTHDGLIMGLIRKTITIGIKTKTFQSFMIKNRFKITFICANYQ
jgi:hypothetical protein